MEIKDRIQNGVTYLAADGLEAAGGVVHGFSTRLGGVSTGIYASMDLGTTRGDDSEHVRENYRLPSGPPRTGSPCPTRSTAMWSVRSPFPISKRTSTTRSPMRPTGWSRTSPGWPW